VNKKCKCIPESGRGEPRYEKLSDELSNEVFTIDVPMFYTITSRHVIQGFEAHTNILDLGTFLS
jgi:hypothetical protein